jgi:hypothetical protein
MSSMSEPADWSGEWLPPGLPADELPPNELRAVAEPAGGDTAPGQKFEGATEALAAVEAGLAFLAHMDPASLPADTLAGCLRGFGRAEAVHTAARSRFLSVFNAQSGSADDGHPTTKSWLRWQTRSTGAAASGQVWWMRRLAVHSRIAAALAAAAISASWARQLCDWTDELPPDVREDADQILLDAAAGGAELPELSRIAEQLHDQTAPPDLDDGNGADAGDDGFADRRLLLDLHYKGSGKLSGDLTPECAAALGAVLDSLGKKAGPEDERSVTQRQHDALEEACRRLLGLGDLPDVAGQPAQVQLHVTLDQLQGRPGAAGAQARWAAAGQAGWLRSSAGAQAYACDATLAPLVTGHIDPVALASLVRDFLAAQHRPGGTAEGCGDREVGAGLPDLLVRWAVDLLSGPAGLAAALRGGTAGPHAAGISLPLDVGAPTATVPPHLRRAVTTRDRHCAFPGCHQRPAGCHVHHVIPRAEGGPTALHNLVLLCSFHHLVAIHRWGWKLALHADGTTTAVSPDGRRTFRSHGPPPAAAA